MKKQVWKFVLGAVVLVVGAFLVGRFAFNDSGLAALPLPEVSEGQRGELGIDKNVNEETIDLYLGRSDAVYRDMRLLYDPADYGAIGGDSYLSGIVDGFEVVPLPYLVNVSGLPEAVGETYKGETLFMVDSEGNYKANYEESLAVLEALFPKDKTIFLMCGGGGYAGMTKNLLVALGWDGSKIYNVGGYWYYNGENNVEIKRVNSKGETVYDFYKVPYHEIDFSTLTKMPENNMVSLSAKELTEKMARGESFLLFVDQGGCTTAEKLGGFFEAFLKERGMLGYKIMFSDMKESSLYLTVKFYPSVVVVRDGEAAAFLRADADEDAAAYNDEGAFREWILKHI